MKIPPDYQINPEIIRLIAQIDSLKFFIESLKIPAPVIDKIQRVSLLKSSLFSARIEGNSLTMEEMETTSDKKQKREIFNILKAAQNIAKGISAKDSIDKKTITMIHSQVMSGLPGDAGRFRREMGAIFNQEGIAVYISPPPHKIDYYILKLIEYIKGSGEQFPLVKAFITHLIFEKIHPFIDGNGRVGRLLVYAVLKSEGYDLGLFIPFEEYLEDHKSDYYYYLDIGLRHADEYIIFMLKAFHFQLEKVKETMLLELGHKDQILLPPRQEEIFNTVRDHRVVSFDFIRRRFLKVPERTLRYDLKRLVDGKLLIKIGKTRGSYYRIRI